MHLTSRVFKDTTGDSQGAVVSSRRAVKRSCICTTFCCRDLWDIGFLGSAGLFGRGSVAQCRLWRTVCFAGSLKMLLGFREETKEFLLRRACFSIACVAMEKHGDAQKRCGQSWPMQSLLRREPEPGSGSPCISTAFFVCASLRSSNNI